MLARRASSYSPSLSQADLRALGVQAETISDAIAGSFTKRQRSVFRQLHARRLETWISEVHSADRSVDECFVEESAFGIESQIRLHLSHEGSRFQQPTAGRVA